MTLPAKNKNTKKPQHCVYDRYSGSAIRKARFTPHNFYNTRGALSTPYGSIDAYTFDFLSGWVGALGALAGFWGRWRGVVPVVTLVWLRAGRVGRVCLLPYPP
jgi:hypothetical protein